MDVVLAIHVHTSTVHAHLRRGIVIFHQSKIHTAGVPHKKEAIFSCHICSCTDLASEKDYFSHINAHLKRNETVICMFLGCDFKTNIYCTFKSHKNRKHRHHTLVDFQPEIVTTTRITSVNELEANSEECVEQSDTAIPSNTHSHTEDLHKVIEHRFAAALLKLEHLFHVPTSGVDEFLEELHHLIYSAAVPLSCDIVSDIFHQRNLPVDELVVRETVDAICSGNPVNFGVIEPVEYKRSFQYVPILKSLEQLLSRGDIITKVVEGHQKQDGTNSGVTHQYRSTRDGSLFKENCFFAGEKPRIILNFYVDDFETCNPLGTSRKKHKLCAVYWVLANLPPGSHSALSSIYLSVLCKTNDVNIYGNSRGAWCLCPTVR